MKPGHPQVVACPACETEHLRRTLLSANTAGTRYFTDGNSYAPMWPASPQYTKCRSCSALFKITEETIEKRHWSELPEDAPYINFLEIDDYVAAIEQGLCNSAPKGSKEQKADVMALRLALWREFNEMFRDPESDAESMNDPRYEDNCRALLAEIPEDGANDTSLLTLAEIHRNLGEYEDCLRLLGRVTRRETFGRYISASTAQCTARSRKTVQVSLAYGK